MRSYSAFRTLGAAMLASIALAACGGGGGGSGGSGGADATSPAIVTPPAVTPAVTPPVIPAAATVDGFYDGKNSRDQSVTSVILSDNSFFLLYSVANDPNTFSGAVYGSGTSQNGSFSASAHDIKLDGSVQTVTLSASYDPKKTFNGSLAYADNSSATFTTNYNPAYETTPTLAALAGVYTGTIAATGLHEALTLTVDSDGKMSGPLLCDCNVSALAQPLQTGNAYRVKIDFKGGTNPLSNQVFSGTAYLDTVAKRLVLIGVLESDQKPAIYVGTRS